MNEQIKPEETTSATSVNNPMLAINDLTTPLEQDLENIKACSESIFRELLNLRTIEDKFPISLTSNINTFNNIINDYVFKAYDELIQIRDISQEHIRD